MGRAAQVYAVAQIPVGNGLSLIAPSAATVALLRTISTTWPKARSARRASRVIAALAAHIGMNEDGGTGAHLGGNACRRLATRFAVNLSPLPPALPAALGARAASNSDAAPGAGDHRHLPG